ncbi:MAG: FecR domain-containing protein [Bacteroides sp.]|nr:FecR domain-containing protein [Bacteroides sp.]
MDHKLLQKYISGNATEAEKQRVTEWMLADPENMREYMAQRKLYDISVWRTDADVMDNGVQNKKRLTMRRVVLELVKIAAIIVLVWGGISYFGTPEEEKKESLQSIYVPAGQRAELMLADGTKVWLNSRTTLTFPGEFSGDTRGVKLDGEGYFAVARNEEQPFVVETNKCNVRVLGTEFNVKAYETDSVWETALLQGSVELLLPGSVADGMRLEPNTMVSLKANKLVKSSIKELDYFRWREGLICFYNITVREMFEKLELYYGVDIKVNNQKILTNRYTGKFRTSDGVEHVLRVLRLKHRFNYTRDDENNQIIIN